MQRGDWKNLVMNSGGTIELDDVLNHAKAVETITQHIEDAEDKRGRPVAQALLEDIPEIIVDYINGDTVEDIAESKPYSRESVRRVLLQLNVPMRKRGARPKQVSKVEQLLLDGDGEFKDWVWLSMWYSGVNLKYIADQYNVGVSTVYYGCNRARQKMRDSIWDDYELLAEKIKQQIDADGSMPDNINV